MPKNMSQNAYKNVDLSKFSCGRKGFKRKPFISKAEGFYEFKKYFNAVEDRCTTNLHRSGNTYMDGNLNLKAGNNQVVVFNKSGTFDWRAKYKDKSTTDRSTTSLGSCISQDRSDGSLIYTCSPLSLPRILPRNSNPFVNRDPLSIKNVNYCFHNSNYKADSEIYLANNECCLDKQVNLLNFLNEWTPSKSGKNDPKSAHSTKCLDTNNFTSLNKCKAINDDPKAKRVVKKQEIQTRSDVCLESVSCEIINKIEIIDSTIKNLKNNNKLNFITVGNSVNDSSVSDFGAHIVDQQNHLQSIKNTGSAEQPVPYRSDNNDSSSKSSMSSVESSFNNRSNGLKKSLTGAFDCPSKEEIEGIYKQAMGILIKNKLELPRLKFEIFESRGENENCVIVDNVDEEPFKDMQEYIPLPSAHDQKFILKEDTFFGNTDDISQRNLNFKINKRNRCTSELPIRKSESEGKINAISPDLSLNNAGIVPSKKFIFSHGGDTILNDGNDCNIINKDLSKNSNNIPNAKSKYEAGKGNTADITTTVSSSKNTDEEINKLNTFLDYVFKKVKVNSESSEVKKSLPNNSDHFTSQSKSPENNSPADPSQSIRKESDIIFFETGEPAVLFDKYGFPLTDLKGRKLKNIFETELLPVKCMEELESSHVQVYDHLNASLEQNDLNPVNGAYLERNEIQILGKDNVPARLYNSLGYPLNDDDGILLKDARGNLMVILDSSGSPLCCSNNDVIYLKNGSLWVNVKDSYNVFHKGKSNKTLNSTLDNNSESSNQSYHVPVTKDVELKQNVDNQIDTDNISQLQYSDRSIYVSLSSKSGDDSLTKIMDEIELSQKVNDYHTAILMGEFIE